MSLSDLTILFNRALFFSFGKRKSFFLFFVLAISGFFVIVCRAISRYTGDWANLALLFLPYFIVIAFLLAVGVVLVRTYHHEVKGIPFSFRKILFASGEMGLKLVTLALPILLAYFLVWILVGIFIFLEEIPFFGPVVGVLLAFAPFLLNLGALTIGIGAFGLLFFLVPIAGLKGDLDRRQTFSFLGARLQSNPFMNLLLAFFSLVPFALVSGLLWLAAGLTEGVVFYQERGMAAMQSFILMLPFAAILTPTITFFFNFSTEAHVYFVKSLSESLEEGGR